MIYSYSRRIHCLTSYYINSNIVSLTAQDEGVANQVFEHNQQKAMS